MMAVLFHQTWNLTTDQFAQLSQKLGKLAVLEDSSGNCCEPIGGRAYARCRQLRHHQGLVEILVCELGLIL